MPLVQKSLDICLEHDIYQVLEHGISQILGRNIEGLNQPEFEPQLGHFISATEIIHGHGKFFNIQINKEDFIKILCKFPIFAHILHQGWNKGYC